MDREIEQFTGAIGAKSPSPDDKIYQPFKLLFKRPNYFLLNGTILIAKISRSSHPFWGVRKRIIELLNNLENYYLVLLVSEREGWAFSKSDVSLKINTGKWKLSHDDEYKINLPLDDKFSFSSHKAFLTKIGIER